MKNFYGKIAPGMTKISRIGLIVSLLGMLLSAILKGSFTEPWPIFYASLAYLIFYYGAIVCAVVQLVFNFSKIWARVWEFLRKTIVSLKRRPSLIPLLMLLVSFLVYSLGLTDVSNTTALIQGKGMGLSQFCIMLFNMLAMLCMLNAFPRRKKVNIPMLALVFVMLGVMIYCDIHYLNCIAATLNNPEGTIKLTPETAYIAQSFNMLATYQTMLFITAGLVVLLPVYSKLLRMIKTSVAVEDNGEMAQIEISD